MTAPGQCAGVGRAAINVGRMLYVCRCGVPGRISHFYDLDGNKTLDPEGAVSAVIELDDGWWQSARLADFDEPLRAN